MANTSMTTLTISLPDSLRKFVDVQVETKGYGNVSEYFRGLLRGAQEEEAEKRLESLLLESLDDRRPDIELTPQFWEAAKLRIAKRAQERKRVRAKR